MDNYTFTTDVSQKLVVPTNEIPECDAYFLVYVKDEQVIFQVHAEDGYGQDLATLISCLPEESFMESIVDTIVETVPDGDLIAEMIYDSMEDGNDIEEEWEASPIIMPCELFSQPHDHDHN